MSSELGILLLTAITIACLHTATGPDHYVPFIALAKSRGWSFARTLFWVTLCGCGHVWSSVLLGLGGALVGWSLAEIRWLESVRGGIAGWALLAFGLLYLGYGLLRARQNQAHKHFDIQGDGAVYVFEHKHGEAVGPQDRHPVTPWVMFLIFLLGPCEPMIPLLSFPAAQRSWWGLLLLVAVYTFFTLATMISLVLLGFYGISFAQTRQLERHLHALGGLTITLCGAGMVLLGW
jgi:sulfite exporter TauE/SafE